jgi:mannose-1-phosphate guanylyltransferase/phosphomannomutase
LKAIVMAGGKGTRLRPLTCDRPKPMVPVVNRPMLEHVIDLLKIHGFHNIIATLYYMPDVIEDYFGDGNRFGVTMHYSVESTPLGTAGSVKACERYLDSTFLVISGDALTDIHLIEAVEFHKSKGAIATIILTRVTTPLEYGVVITDNDSRITRFLEKPSWSEVFSDTVNTGIYILEPEALRLFDAGQQFDFSKNLFPLILKKGLPLFGYVADGYWSDVGNIEQYRQTHYDILQGLVEISIPGDEIAEGIYIGTGTEIHSNAGLAGPMIIGDHCRIRQNVDISPGTVIGHNNILSEGVSLKRSVLWDDSFFGKDAELRGAIVCSKASLKEKSKVFEGSVVGSGSILGVRSIIKPGVKIWPEKLIDAGTTIATSLIWGTKWSKRLFGTYGVSGLVNLELTPEIAVKLGASYISCFREKPSIVISSDVYKPSRMIKRAIISGLLSGGAKVYDLGRMITPVTRYAVAALEMSGGLHVRLSPYDPGIVLIEFLDEKGMNIEKSTERRIENAFFSEDFARVSPDDIGEVAFLTHLVEEYLDCLLQTISVGLIKEKQFHVMVDYDPGNLSLILPSFLSALGCKVFPYCKDSPGSYRPRHPLDMLDSLSFLSKSVATKGVSIGIIVDSNAERLLLVDELGNKISGNLFTALISLLALRSREGTTVTVPVTAPRIIEDMAKVYGGHVVRTGVNPRSVMERAIEERVFAGKRGLFGFQPPFDALFSLGKILESMARDNMSLSELISMVPEFYMSKHSVGCPWEAKGKVMRTLINETGTKKIELIDGIKIYHETGWALVLPDSEEPLFHIYSEASSPKEAKALREAYIKRINKIL